MTDTRPSMRTLSELCGGEHTAYSDPVTHRVRMVCDATGFVLFDEVFGPLPGRSDDIKRTMERALAEHHVATLEIENERLRAAALAVLREWDERGDGGCTLAIQSDLRRAVV